MITRRSLFGLIGGAVAAGAVAKASPVAKPAPAIVVGNPRVFTKDDILRDGFEFTEGGDGTFRFLTFDAAPLRPNDCVRVDLHDTPIATVFTGVVHSVRSQDEWGHLRQDVQGVIAEVVRVTADV